MENSFLHDFYLDENNGKSFGQEDLYEDAYYDQNGEIC